MKKKNTELWIAMGILLLILLSAFLLRRRENTETTIAAPTEDPKTVVLYPPLEEESTIDREIIQAESVKEEAKAPKAFLLSNVASIQLKSGLSGRGAVIEDPAVIAKIVNNMGELVFLWTANLESAPGYAYDLVFLDDSGVKIDGFMILDTEGTQIYCDGWNYTADGNGKIDVAYIAELIEE